MEVNHIQFYTDYSSSSTEGERGGEFKYTSDLDDKSDPDKSDPDSVNSQTDGIVHWIESPAGQTYNVIHGRDFMEPRKSRLVKFLQPTTFSSVPQTETDENPRNRVSLNYSVGGGTRYDEVRSSTDHIPLGLELESQDEETKRRTASKRRRTADSLYRNSRLCFLSALGVCPSRPRVWISFIGMILAGLLLLSTILLVTISAVIELSYSTKDCEKFARGLPMPKKDRMRGGGTFFGGLFDDDDDLGFRDSGGVDAHSFLSSFKTRRRQMTEEEKWLEEKGMIADRGWNASTWPDELRLHHFRVLGTHNSYHLSSTMPLSPNLYSHAPLYDQLGSYTRGVRQIELDVHLIEDTMVVYHLQIVDDHTTCYCLLECLSHVRRWSEAHPYHFPISVFFEIKAKLWEDVGTSLSGVTSTHIGVLNKHIRDSFPVEKVISPALVLGPHKTFAQALKSSEYGWPAVKHSLGKVMFVWLDEKYDLASTVDQIVEDPSLRDQLFFIGSRDLSLPYVTVAILNNPRDPKYKEKLKEARDRNLLVRSLADNENSVTPDKKRFDMLLDYSPNYITTDFDCTTDSGITFNDDDNEASDSDQQPPSVAPTTQVPTRSVDGLYCELLPSQRPFECNPKASPIACSEIEFFPSPSKANSSSPKAGSGY